MSYYLDKLYLIRLYWLIKAEDVVQGRDTSSGKQTNWETRNIYFYFQQPYGVSDTEFATTKHNYKQLIPTKFRTE